MDLSFDMINIFVHNYVPKNPMVTYSCMMQSLENLDMQFSNKILLLIRV